MERYIGIRHRVKQSAKGEARPTQVVILEGRKTTSLVLETEGDELEFIKGKKNGLRNGDQVAMMLGGSGDYLAYAIARRAEHIGAYIFRIPPFIFQKEMTKEGEERDKDKDAHFLAQLLAEKPGLFYKVGPRDLQLIWVRETLRARMEAMKSRIACEQRLRQRFIGKTFCSPEGLFPEGDIEKHFDALKADDVIYQALLKEEKRCERELIKACEALDIYRLLFKPLEGCGVMIASRLIGAVIDIRRFETPSKLRAFCGVHVLSDGRFPRRRNNQVANWNPDCRQALYLLGEQFNRRPDSEWGKRLRAVKVEYHSKHPEVVVENGKKRYTDGHIHKMAVWYTLGKFVEWMFGEWWKLEKENQPTSPVPAPELVGVSS